MTEYIVQFVLPVDNPEHNVIITKKGQSYLFEVPLNYPDAHKLGFFDLIAAAELSGLFRPSSTLNTDRESKKEIAVVKKREQSPKQL